MTLVPQRIRFPFNYRANIHNLSNIPVDYSFHQPPLQLEIVHSHHSGLRIKLPWQMLQTETATNAIAKNNNKNKNKITLVRETQCNWNQKYTKIEYINLIILILSLFINTFWILCKYHTYAPTYIHTQIPVTDTQLLVFPHQGLVQTVS